MCSSDLSHISQGPPSALPSLDRALAIRPNEPYDSRYRPDLEAAYFAAQRKVRASGPAVFRDLSESVQVWVDGFEVPKEGLPVIRGEHLVQVRGRDQMMRGVVLQLYSTDLAVVSDPGALAYELHSVDASGQRALRRWMAARFGQVEQARAWVVDAGGHVFALAEEQPVVRRRGAGGGAASGRAPGLVLESKPPLLQIALGGGWQRGGSWDYALLAADLSLRIVGPLRLQVQLRPAITKAQSSLADGVSYAAVASPVGVGLLLRVPGAIHPSFAVVAQVGAAQAGVDPDGPLPARPLFGVDGMLGMEIPMGRLPLALRSAAELSLLGRVLAVRVMGEIVVGVGGG